MGALADHLWQSTWFALGAALLTLVVRNDARLRHWLWLAASVKFLIPFSLLTLLGRQLVWQVDEEALLPLVQHVTAPLTSTVLTIEPLEQSALRVAISIWVLGSVLLAIQWGCRWWLTRKLVNECAPYEDERELGASIPVRTTNALSEPGVVGVVSPVLLIPAHLSSKLTASELRCIIAHESWHVRRRDNLTAALHAVVQVLFWFHPLVWWIGVRLVETREQACDEGALRDGADSKTYAEAILHVCRHSVESRQVWLASAAGGDLKTRIRSIMSHRRPPRFTMLKQALLGAALAGCIVLPVAAGITLVSVPELRVPAGVRAIHRSDEAGPTFFAARDSYVYARNVSLRQLISHAYDIDDRDVKGNLPWLDRPLYNVEMRAPANAAIGHRELVAELLKEQFNLDLIVRPTAEVRSAGLAF